MKGFVLFQGSGACASFAAHEKISTYGWLPRQSQEHGRENTPTLGSGS